MQSVSLDLAVHFDELLLRSVFPLPVIMKFQGRDIAPIFLNIRNGAPHAPEERPKLIRIYLLSEMVIFIS